MTEGRLACAALPKPRWGRLRRTLTAAVLRLCSSRAVLVTSALRSKRARMRRSSITVATWLHPDALARPIASALPAAKITASACYRNG